MSRVLQNKKQLLVFLFAMLMSALGMRANPVDLQTAREVAMKFVNANTKVALRGTDDLQLVTTYRTESDDAAFHIFNTPNGFVIVSADDCATPILGYSDEGQFDTENIPIQLQDILQGYVEQIQYGIEYDLEADERTTRQWELVRTTGRITNNRSNRKVEPLLTAKWGQNCYYNAMCPEDENGPCGHCVTGCVATAMAQIMHYWSYPEHGTGSYSYTPNGYPEQSVDFGATTYDWDNMFDNYPETQEQEEAVATLMWHCGVSVNMSYGPDVSTAGIHSSSLINYFNYSDEMSEESRRFFSDASWKAKLKDCLGLGRPVCYEGAPDVGIGHAFVCDGYDGNELFHFNFGWSGTSDGYYTIDGLGYDYSGAIFNIHPQGETTTYVINVSVNSVEGGSVSGGGTFAHGENVTLSATANDGYGFCYWEENGDIASTDPNYSFTANYNRDLVAVFAEPFTVTVSASEGGTAVGGGSYFYGESCAVTATPNEGYNFANWTANDFVVSISANYTYSVTGNTILTAHFVAEGNIEFADANVKAICVTHWDTNGDGELSYVEAAAVTSFGEVFRGNTEITSFEELQYFVSLTSINNYAFDGCSGLTGSLIIPEFVASIGRRAFGGCSGLTGSLILPNTVTSIGRGAFGGCSGLTGSLILPNTVTSIGNDAFSACSGLTGSLIISNRVTSIGSYAFYNCSGLTSIEIPNSVTSIAPYAFSDCSGLHTVYYAGDIHQWCTIQFGNFSSNPLRYAHNLYIDNELVTELVIPETITEIKDYVFDGATCLTSLTIPNTVTSIGSYAFSGCSGLTGNLTIPNTVTSIGSHAFYNCSSLTGELIIPNSVTLIDFGAFRGCGSLTGDLIIPNSVTSIGSEAFYDCDGLTSLVLGNSVTSIGRDAFHNCSGFTGSLTIPNSVTSIGSSAFENCSGFTGSLTIPNSVTSIGVSAFSYCSGFTGSLIIPNSIISIGYYTFRGCSGLTGSLIIPNSVTTIDIHAFEDCDGLTSLVLGNSVTSINQYAFCNCSRLISMVIFAETPPTVELRAFYQISNNIPIYVPCESVEAYQTAEGWNAFPNIMCISSGTISVVADPLEGGEVSGGGMYEGGDFCTVTATPNDGYCFANWTENGHIVSSDSNYSFVVTGESVLTAHFVPVGNIVFADANVKAICVNHWDTNGDGELSYIEAASVTSLGGAFCSNTEITSFEELQYFVNLSTIGNYAFYNCSSLTGELIIPNSVTLIDYGAFWGCSGLTGDLIIPNSVTEIGEFAFYDCNGFTGNLIISNSVTSIGGYAFYNCSSLTGNLTIPNSVTSIGNYAFRGCSGMTGNLTIPNSVTSIGSCAFISCSGLTGDLIIPNSVTTIGSSAFYGCSGFNGNLMISNSLTSINEETFYYCSGLTGELSIPNSVTSIGEWAFCGCSGFTGDLTIPNSVTSIGGWAFYNCSGFMGNLIIGNSVTNIGNYVFYNCSSLTGLLIIPNTVSSIGNYAFYNCSGLTGNLTIPNSVTSIGYGAFRGCSDLTGNLSIPNSVTWIGDHAFYNCSGFNGSLTIPNSVTSIGGWAFYNCSSLTGDLIIPNSLTSISNYTFYGCSGLTGNLTIPNSVTSIGGSAFYNCSSLTGNLIIPNSVTSIGNYAFYNCSGLTGDLTISNSVTSIGGSAFYNCCGLTGDLVIPNSVTSISNYTFYGCSGFTGSLTIPNSVTSIGYGAFSGCSGLTGNLTIPNSVTSIGNSAFSNCSGFSGNLIISNSLTTISYGTFYNCSGLTSLVIPNSVTSIDYYAFHGCSSLTSITSYSEIPPTTTIWAFFNCPKSIPVYVPCGSAEVYQSADGWNEFTNIQEVCTQSQTVTLSQGWNWFSTNVEITLDNLKAALVEALPGTTITIKSKNNGTSTYNGTTWRGQLTTLDVTQMYRISVSTACEITLEGMLLNPAEHPVTISNGANWIAFPFGESITVNDAFAGFAVSGDVVKSKENGIATYNGTQWRGTLNTLESGQGYIYKSAATGTRTFTFPTSTK